jgi:hypothetical protein
VVGTHLRITCESKLSKLKAIARDADNTQALDKCAEKVDPCCLC